MAKETDYILIGEYYMVTEGDRVLKCGESKKTNIMNKTKDSIKAILREQWENACNGYLVELLRMWDLDAHYGYWIADEVGGVYDYGDGMMTINMDDIIYCVENDVESKEYTAWQEYICDAAEFGFDTPNLKSWCHGCPRTPQEVFERLRGLKADLAKAVEDEKERMKNEKSN